MRQVGGKLKRYRYFSRSLAADLNQRRVMLTGQ